MFVLRAPVPHMFRSNTGVAVRLAHTPEDLAVAETVAVRGLPAAEAAGLPPNALFGAGLLGGALRIRVAAVEGTPAAIGSSHVAHGVVNLCLAATLPTARRRGAWESLVWARIDDGPGLPAAAFTSDDSRPGFLQDGVPADHSVHPVAAAVSCTPLMPPSVDRQRCAPSTACAAASS